MKQKENPDTSQQKHQGTSHSAPYPVSRMAPSFDLVNLAEEIVKRLLKD